MYIFNSCFYCPSFLSTIFLRGHCSINPCFWEGVDVVCQTFLLSSCIALSFHTTRKNYATLIPPFGRGLILYIYIYTYFFLSRISPIILHCSVNPCFWEGVDVACQTFLLSSYIALSFHTTREELFNHSTLIHYFGRGLIIYIYIYLSFKNIFYHPSLLYRSMLLGGGGCCMSKCSFIILHCSVSHTTRTNTLPLLPPLGGDWFYIHSYIHTFLSRIFSIILHVSPSPHFWKNAIRPLIPF